MRYILILSLIFLSACTKCTKDKSAQTLTNPQQSVEGKIPDRPLEQCMDGTGAKYGDKPFLRHKMPYGFTLILCGEKQENDFYSNFNVYPVDKNEQPQRRVLMVEKENFVKLDFSTDEVVVTEFIPLGEKLIPYLSATITCNEKHCVRSASKCEFEKIETSVNESILKTLDQNTYGLDKKTALNIIELALSGNKKALSALDNLELRFDPSNNLEAMRDSGNKLEADSQTDDQLAEPPLNLNAIRSAVANLQSLNCF